jgi:hypothetical protein
MDSLFHWTVVAGSIGILALGLTGFVRGFSLPPNAPEHRSNDKADNWRYWGL